MARGLFMSVCLLLALASETRTQSSNKIILDELKEMKDTLAEIQKSLSGGSLGPVVAQLVAGQTTMQKEIDTSSSSLSSMKEDLQEMTFRLQKTEEELQASKDLGLKTDQGSTFVRWGRTTCPANATLVYSGVAAGKHFTQSGSGSNILCMTRSPQFDNTTTPTTYGYLYGAEYQQIGDHTDNDVPCSVCRAPQSTTIMMAATLTCPEGWTVQYTGHLTSQYHSYHATEYVCLDGEPENDRAGKENHNGLLFYHVLTKCGSLPCPPYADNKVVTCVVCSK